MRASFCIASKKSPKGVMSIRSILHHTHSVPFCLSLLLPLTFLLRHPDRFHRLIAQCRVQRDLPGMLVIDIDRLMLRIGLDIVAPLMSVLCKGYRLALTVPERITQPVRFALVEQFLQRKLLQHLINVVAIARMELLYPEISQRIPVVEVQLQP